MGIRTKDLWVRLRMRLSRGKEKDEAFEVAKGDFLDWCQKQ